MHVHSRFQMSCVLPAGAGLGLPLKLVYEGNGNTLQYSLPNAVSYDAMQNLKQAFKSFQEYGVGGLDKFVIS